MTEEREQELVTGTVGGIIQKDTDKWQVEVTPDGSQYAKKLWTKSSGHQQAFAGLFGQRVTVLCNVSHWTNQAQQPVRSLWIDTINPDGTENTAPEATGATQSASQPSRRQIPSGGGDTTRESIERQVSLKAAVEFFAGSNATTSEVLNAAEEFDVFLARGRVPVSALVPDNPPEPIGDEDIPF